jgi:hypothetical protein
MDDRLGIMTDGGRDQSVQCSTGVVDVECLLLAVRIKS